MSLYAIPAILALIINVTLCLVVFFNNPRGAVNLLFTLLILTFVAWNAGELIMISADQPSAALVGVKIIFAGIFLFPALFLHFSYVFPQKLTRFFDGLRCTLLYAGPVGLLVPFILLLQVDIGRVQKIGNIFYYVFTFKGPLESHLLALLLALLSLGYFAWGVVNFILSYGQTKIARQRLQILYLMVGILSMFFIGLILHAANYLLDLGYSFFFVASLYSLLISFFFALAILKYRLLDIHLIIRGGILYSLLSGLVLVIYVLFIKNVCDLLAKKFEVQSLLVEAIFVLILVFLLRPLERRVEEFIDRFFYRDRYLFRLKFFEFTRTVLNILDLQALLRAAVDFLTSTLAVEKVAVLIAPRGSGSYRLVGHMGFDEEIAFSRESPLLSYLREVKRTVEMEDVKEVLPQPAEAAALIAAGISLAVPLEGEEGMMGVLLVGEKRNRKGFTIMEMETLEALAPTVAMGISRALLYQDLKARDRQMMQAEKLAALGEMAASFVHEIRNPLGIVLGSVETLKKKIPQAVQSEMLQFIQEESERINRMLSSFLEFAKPKPPVFREVDLRKILERTVELISLPARKQHIRIRQEYGEEKISLPLDPEQIHEALINLELNALEAMPAGGMLHISLFRDEKQGAVIRVADSGVGIPPGAESKIFDPFFTTKEKGTGLGLSIVHAVVKNHGGTVSVSANGGQGSIFTMTLPPPQGIRGCFGGVGPGP